jgi:hypothetical protein
MIAAVGAACHANSVPVTTPQLNAPALASRQAGPRERLAAAEALWAASKVEAYQFTIRVMCFCPPEITGPNIVLVSGGSGRLQTPRNAPVATFLEQYDTVEKLFAVARDALERQAFKLSLSFDAKHGFPTSIDINYRERMADDEVRIVVSDFKAAGTRARAPQYQEP